jgi:hypothetical protein
MNSTSRTTLQSSSNASSLRPRTEERRNGIGVDGLSGMEEE